MTDRTGNSTISVDGGASPTHDSTRIQIRKTGGYLVVDNAPSLADWQLEVEYTPIASAAYQFYLNGILGRWDSGAYVSANNGPDFTHSVYNDGQWALVDYRSSPLVMHTGGTSPAWNTRAKLMFRKIGSTVHYSERDDVKASTAALPTLTWNQNRFYIGATPDYAQQPLAASRWDFDLHALRIYRASKA